MSEKHLVKLGGRVVDIGLARSTAGCTLELLDSEDKCECGKGSPNNSDPPERRNCHIHRISASIGDIFRIHHSNRHLQDVLSEF